MNSSACPWDKLPRFAQDSAAQSWSEGQAAELVEAGLGMLVDARHKFWQQTSLEQIRAHVIGRADLTQSLRRRVLSQAFKKFLLDAIANQVVSKVQMLSIARDLNLTSYEYVGKEVGSKVWVQAGAWSLHELELRNSIEFMAAMPNKCSSLKQCLVMIDGLLLLEQKEGQSCRQFLISMLSALIVIHDAKLVAHISKVRPSWLSLLLDEEELPTKVLLALKGQGAPEDVRKWRHRVLFETNHAQERFEALCNLKEPLPLGFVKLIGPDQRRELSGQDLVLFILSNRDNLKRLRWALKDLEQIRLRSGLKQAAEILAPSDPGLSLVFEISQYLGMDWAPRLIWLLAQRDKSKAVGHKLDHLYFQWKLPKKAGGNREISAPNPVLKAVQRKILEILLNPLEVHACAHGFVAERGIITNALNHINQPIVANIDVQNCFPSVKWPLIRYVIRRDLSHQLSEKAQAFLADIVSGSGALPTGAPTSPAMLNRVLLKTDEILAQAAQDRGCNYSRYADDLTFSGGHEAIQMLGVATGVLGKIGLNIDPKKTNIFRRGRRQMCTGLVVNVKPNVPRHIRKKLRAAIHALSVGRKPTWHGKEISLQSLRGRIEYHRMVAPESTEGLLAEYEQALSNKGM